MAYKRFVGVVEASVGVYLIARVALTWGIGFGRHGYGMAGMAVVVRMVVNVGVVAVVPTRTVDIVVVGIVVHHRTRGAYKGVVRRHCPHEGGSMVGVLEAQVLCRAIDVAILHQIDALKVDGHEDFLTRVGIVAIKPYLVERRADLLGPYFVDEYVGGQLVLVATVNHQLVLIVQAGYCACCLAVGEIKDVLGCDSHRRHHQCQC